jgi:NhaP-type Na+/H+ and K+/H+ antiporter
MAFGVVLFTLLIQATTISSLVQRLKIIARNPAKEAYQIGQAELLASRAALAHLEHRYKEGLISAHAWGRLRSNLQDQQVELTRGVRSILQNDPTLEAEELENAQKEILRAKRSAYLGLRRDGLISQDIYELLNNQVDSELQAEQEKASVEGVGQELGEALDDLELQELMIEPGSSLEGRQIRHIAWPENFIIARIKRNNQVLFPTGNTPVQAGDNLVVVADEKAFQEAQRMSQAETSSKT